MSLLIRSKKTANDPSAQFWAKVERIFGEIPKLIRLILQFNGFDSFLALKGIQWDDKRYFFQALEESITGLAELDDSDHFKDQIKSELEYNNQTMERFKLKLGHKNLIINLCHELQKTSLEEFNAIPNVIKIPDKVRPTTDIVIRTKNPDEEHGYSREDSIETPPMKRQKFEPLSSAKIEVHDVPSPESSEQIHYIYEEDDEGSQYVEQEYLDDGSEIVEYQEIPSEVIGSGGNIYTAEEIIKSEAEQSECYEYVYEHDNSSDSHHNRSTETAKNKKPKHMYTDEFLHMQIVSGRIGTPGRRRPKIQKQYPETEEGYLERWADLVRQSCEVIVPNELLSKFDLSMIDIVKVLPNIWEVKCPMCTKKLRLQLTHEGKYVNFKRSNFERHLRIVHFKQIAVFKGNDELESGELIEMDRVN